MSEQCLDCGGALAPCTCRPGCPGSVCAIGCYFTNADAVKLARAWIAQNQQEHGGPVTTLATERDIHVWCRSVVAQDERIQKLRAALETSLQMVDTAQGSNADTCAELRRLLA